MRLSILLALLFFSYVVKAQTAFNSEDLRVIKNDLIINTYEKDSTANALVIYEQGNSYYDNKEYKLKTEIKRKVKIFNNKGYKHATVEIFLYKDKSNKEKVENIIATTYNLNDNSINFTKIKEEDIFTEMYDENTTLVKFTLPNIKAGSVITYSYTKTSPFMFKYEGWWFQEDIPKLFSEYKASIPGNFVYHKKLVGGKKLLINESKIKENCLQGSRGAYADCENSVYAMKDIPAFISEDYMTTKKNYIARIEYELQTLTRMDGTIINYTKTWKDTDKEFRKDKEIGKQLKKTVNAEELLTPELFNEANTLEKAKSIYEYVQNNYTWNGDFKIFTDVSVKDLINNRSGNVSSINILLHNLLNESGIEAKPVLLSTRKNGYPTQIYPVISDFNYIIVQTTIDNKTSLLDATDKYLTFGDLPFRCLNRYARLMDFNEGSKWIDINPSSKSSIMYNVEINFDEEQNLVGQVKNRLTGYHALDLKKSYFTDKNSYLERLENNSPFIDIYNHEVSSNITSDKFSESYDIEYISDEINDLLYLNPFIIKFFSENPFKLQERTYPIDFGYKDNYLYYLSFNLGDEYLVKEKPEDIRLGLPNNAGELAFSTKVVGNIISLVFKIDFKSAVYPPEYYPYLKEFMSKVVDIQKNSLFVLEKK